MNSKQVSAIIFSNLDQKWCQERVSSLEFLTKKSTITKSDIQTMKEDFENFYFGQVFFKNS